MQLRLKIARKILGSGQFGGCVCGTCHYLTMISTRKTEYHKIMLKIFIDTKNLAIVTLLLQRVQIPQHWMGKLNNVNF